MGRPYLMRINVVQEYLVVASDWADAMSQSAETLDQVSLNVGRTVEPITVDRYDELFERRLECSEAFEGEPVDG